MVSKPRRYANFLLLLVVASVFSLQAAGAGKERLSMPETLDHKPIHEQYNEGNFESVITALETFMQRNPTFSHTDSVFIAKHLAVVYSANPATREKGRYYMYRLLELLPSAKLVDMYVSEEIDRIFEKVREEFLARQRNFGINSPPELTAAPPSKSQDRESSPPAKSAQSGRERKPEKGNTGFWIAGGTVVVLAGAAAAYFIHQEETAPDAPHYNVPASVSGK